MPVRVQLAASPYRTTPNVRSSEVLPIIGGLSVNTSPHAIAEEFVTVLGLDAKIGSVNVNPRYTYRSDNLFSDKTSDEFFMELKWDWEQER